MTDRLPLILGLNAVFHESAAALVQGDRILAAVEEERLSRVKHAKRAAIDDALLLPFRAIDACLAQAGVSFRDLDAVGYSFAPGLRLARNRGLPGAADLPPASWGTAEGERRLCALTRLVPRLLERRYGVPLRGRFHFLEHHACHLASAFDPSPFAEAAVLSVDGIGEWTTTALAHGRGGRLEVLEERVYPDSLGFVWEALTSFLGFRANGDEAKVMGLASWGDPARYREAFSRILAPGPEGRFVVGHAHLGFRTAGGPAGLEALLGPRRLLHEPVQYQGADRRHADLAAALQEATNRVLLDLARRAHARTGAPALCLGGGVALNCVANGVIAREGPFADVWVQPAAHDAGTALGAALLLARRRYHLERQPTRTSVYTGPAYPREACLAALRAHRLEGLLVDTAGQDQDELVAGLLAQGRIVGWFQGALEWGPRALGHRSLLADPRVAAMPQVLNRRVKHREDFRPFCPSVLAEEAEAWFDFGGRPPPAACDYMLVTCPVRPGRREQIPAVVHVDGTSRVQLVRAADEPRYHRLLRAFQRHTGVPLVLNTSFNDSEPIVGSPTDAIRCFLSTRIDDLVLGDLLVSRPGVPS